MRAIVNLSTEKYWPGQNRLIRSLKDKTDATLFLYRSEDEVGAPPHSENPYAFKIYAIEKVFEAGYEQVLWLDASMYVVRNLAPLFDMIDGLGYYMQYSGWENDRWTNETAKEYFGTNEGSMLSTGCIGFNFQLHYAREFFRQWKQSMLDGIFKGSWDDHRQDQTCASIIAHKMGFLLAENNSLFQYGKAEESPLHNDILLIADGIC